MGNTAILVMDNSGSMGKNKRELGVSYFDKVAGEDAKKTYIGFTLNAIEYDTVEELLDSELNGGTYASSGLTKAYDNILDLSVREVRKSKVILVTDGDNWGEDNDVALSLVTDLLKLNVEVHFVEIKVSRYSSTLLFKLRDGLMDYIESGKLQIVKPVIEYK